MDARQDAASSWVKLYARRLRGVYYAGFGLAFLATWVWPTVLGEGTLRIFVFYVILESIALMTSFALILPWVKDAEAEGRGWVSLVWVPLGTAFAFVLARSFGIVWGMVPFVLSLAALGEGVIGEAPGSASVKRVKNRLVATFLVFMAAGVCVMVLPTPALGITDAIVAQQGFDQMQVSSDFFDAPEAAMMWGSLYFGGLALAQWFRLPQRLGRWETTDAERTG